MKITYESDYIVRVCSSCGYKHKEKHTMGPDRYVVDPGFGKKEFILGETQFIFEADADYGPRVLRRKNVYACPNCGILQVESENNHETLD